MAIEDLIKHGPLKPQETRGLKETELLEPDIEDKYKVPIPKMPERVGPNTNPDPSSYRIGWTLEDEVNKTILGGVEKAKLYISANQVQAKVPMKLDDLFEHIELLKAGVMIGYPAYHGLPDWEPAVVLLQTNIDFLRCEEPNTDYLNMEKVTLWCAGKEYQRGKLLSDFVGKNEKTKIVCKFGFKGQGAPVREPLIDKETHSKMLAFYYKKQEETKKLENENDDNYLNSKWADPKNLKNSLYTGGNDIKWKFK